MTNHNLKPCPFCGGEAVVVEPDEVMSGGHDWCVRCKQDRCPAFSCPDGEFGYLINDYPKKEKAVAAWNNRPREEELARKVEILREGLEFYADANHIDYRKIAFYDIIIRCADDPGEVAQEHLVQAEEVDGD